MVANGTRSVPRVSRPLMAREAPGATRAHDRAFATGRHAAALARALLIDAS